MTMFIVPLFCLFIFSAGILQGAEITDFAPLSVGNSWEYTGSSGSGHNSGSSYQFKKEIQVITKEKINDTVRYRLKSRDSLYSGFNTSGNDTVIYTDIQFEEIDGRFFGTDSTYCPKCTPIPEYNYIRHSYSESIFKHSGCINNSIGCVIIDTTIEHRMLPSNGIDSVVVSRVIFKITLEKGIGITHSLKLNQFVSSSTEYRLTKYNGVPLSELKITPIAIVPKREKNHEIRLNSFGFQNYSINPSSVDWNGISLNGRLKNFKIPLSP
jgi:hypothetical protein